MHETTNNKMSSSARKCRNNRGTPGRKILMTGKDEIGERSRQRGLQQENQQLNEILQEAKEAIETMRQQMEELRIEKEDRDGTTSAAPQAKKQARTQRRTKASKIHRHSEGTGAQAAELTGRH